MKNEFTPPLLQEPDRLIDTKGVCELLCCKRAALYSIRARRPDFPQPHPLSRGNHKKWLRSVIVKYITDLQAQGESSAADGGHAA